MKPTLVILAAGIGNRYGGLKQMDGVGPSGETIVDYSIYDAVRAGFGKIVFVIRRSIESEFREVFFERLRRSLDIDYVFQELEDLPEGMSVPEGRTKPWGTSHAVIAAAAKVGEPFAAINADDFYGLRAYEVMAGFLRTLKNEETSYALVGYELNLTLSEHGSVARGVCEVDAEGMLTGIVERTCVERTPDGIVFKESDGRSISLSGRETASMNFWGFTPTFFAFARREFEIFFQKNINNPKAELFIPLVVNELIVTGQVRVKVLKGGEKWFGVTYKEDRPRVVEEIRKLVAAGIYPEKLF